MVEKGVFEREEFRKKSPPTCARCERFKKYYVLSRDSVLRKILKSSREKTCARTGVLCREVLRVCLRRNTLAYEL